MAEEAGGTVTVDCLWYKWTNKEIVEKIRSYKEESQDAIFDCILWLSEKWPDLRERFGVHREE